jgi:pimeloyl-ACP methyl ester carboxylesterase
MQRFNIALEGGHVAALNFGRASGPVDVVFLHATGFCALAYRHLLEALGPDLRVVALDQRGHGRTTLPAHPGRLTSWEGYARDAICAIGPLAECGGPPRLIAGHSMGAVVGLLSLARSPSLAATLLMIDPPIVPARMRPWIMMPFGTRLAQRRFPLARGALARRAVFPSRDDVLRSYRGRGAFRSWLPGFLEDYVADGFAQRTDGSVELACAPAWESATFAGQRHDVAAALRALKTPARVLFAEHDSPGSHAIPMFAECAPALAVETVAGCTHFIPMEQPALVRERMLGMLRR